MRHAYYQGMDTDSLRREIDTLREQLQSAEEILANRKGITLYKCCECSLTDPDDEVIFQHLCNDHNYPEEDAGYGTERIFA